MKFTSPAPRLLKAIQALASLAPGTGKRFQIESTLLTVTDTGALEVQATDMADSFWFRVDPMPDVAFTPGKLFIGSANLLRAVKEAGKADVSIETVSNHSALITWGSTKVRLPAEMIEDAPTIKRFNPTDPTVQLPASDLIALLKRVNFATSTDFKSRSMAFVRIEVKPTGLRLGATDGVRIASVEVDLVKDASYVATAYVMPIKPARIKLLVDGDDKVMLKLRVTQDMITLATDSAEMTIRTGHAQWPDYDIDKQLTNTKVVTIPTANMKQLLNGADLLKVKGETTCEFKLTATLLEMEAISTIEGAVNSAIPIEWKYDPFTIRLDPSFLWDAVNACDADSVELSFDTNQQPVKLREAEGSRLYLYALGARH
jgi:DNA polymerase III sliding clamp (beta) subunit (PCNA family)